MMQQYYGEANILRALDEAEFWKHQEAEHTQVIQLVTPELEEEYVSTLKGFNHYFNDAYGLVTEYIETVIRSENKISSELDAEIVECIRYCIHQSTKFIDFLNHMLNTSQAVKSNSSSQVVIEHVIRESRYFTGVEQAYYEPVF